MSKRRPSIDRCRRIRTLRVLSICGSLLCGSAVAQTWVLADSANWYWSNGESRWSPDEATLREAMAKLEAAFHRTAAEAAPGPVPPWDAYTLEYQGRIVGNARAIRVAGDCDFDSRTVAGEDGTRERILVTGGGGNCLFRASYDTTTSEVTEFRFNAPY